MKSKYTVVYTDRWQSGSHHHALTKMKRVELDCNDSNRLPQIVALVGTEDVQYIFEGWPKMLGETD